MCIWFGILPDDSDRPGHFPSATDPVAVNCHSIPHTVSFSGWHPVSISKIYAKLLVCTCYNYTLMWLTYSYK